MKDEIETLRQRVKVLESFDGWQEHPYTKVLMKSIGEDFVPRTDIATLKQGQCEPVAWLELGEDEFGIPEPVAAHINEPNIGWHRKVPLYAIPPTVAAERQRVNDEQEKNIQLKLAALKARAKLTAKRSISDKLEKAMQEYSLCKDCPEHIWLQWDDEEGYGAPQWDGGGVTWCTDKINSNDALYIRADLTELAAMRKGETE